MDGGSAVDAAPEAGVVFIGTWDRIAGLDPQCTEQTARDPAPYAMRWKPCPSGRAGCQLLEVDWRRSYRPDILHVDRPNGVQLIGTQPFIRMRRNYHTPSGQDIAWVDVIQPLHGPPVLAIGDLWSSWCYGAVDVGPAGFGMRYSDSQGTHELGVGFASWSSPRQFAMSLFPLADAAVQYFPNFSIGPAHLMLETRGPINVAIYDPATRAITYASPNVPAESPIAVVGGAYVLDTRSPFSVDFVRTDGTWERIVQPTAPQIVSYYAVERSAGEALVWFESDRDIFGYYNTSIWTTPYATTAATVQKRKVAVIPDGLKQGGADAVANKGVVLNIIALDRALLTRLSDGMGWDIAPEPGEAFVRPLWVDDDEVWMITCDPKGPTCRANAHGIQRISRAPLGPPTVPRGF